MKYSFTVLLIYSITIVGNSQPLNGRQWTSVKLPVDSLVPASFFAYDSLKAFYTATATHRYFDDLQQKYLHYHTTHYFQTDDGGKSWIEKYKTGYGDTIAQLSTSTFFFFTWKNRITAGQDDSLGNYFHYYSSNYGNSWNKQYITPSKDGIYPLATYSNNGLLSYSEDSGYLYRSTDYGRNFPVRLGNGIFHNTLRPVDTLSQEQRDLLGISKLSSEIRMAVKDPLHYTVFAIPSGTKPDSTFFPYGVTTIVTTNGGASWERHINPIPNYIKENRLPGILQYDSEKNILYYFISVFGEGRLDCNNPNNSDPNNTTTNLPGEGSYGFSYMWSTDDGRTWNFNEEYGLKRRAYEPVATGEIWMTTTPNDIGINGSGYQPAYYIKRTTNFGETWETDSTTLGTLFEQKADGRVIAFSDPHHGWVVARIGATTYILSYNANEQPLAVESDKGPTYYYPMWLHPIPATDEVEVHFLNKGTIENIELYDIMGRKKECTYTSNGNEGKVTLRNVPSGHYFVHVKLSGKYYSRPLIVRK